LGAEICHTFAQAGWHVLCQYQRSAQAAHTLCAELRAAGHTATAVAGMLGHEAGRIELMHTALAISGHVHCLINNASAFEPDTGLGFDPHLAQEQLEINLMAPLSLARELARQPTALAPVERSVIHILDQKVYNLNPDYFSYTISKLALERAVSLQAQALAPHVRVCGVAPGLMYLSGPQSADNFARASRVNLLQRPTDPSDVAKTCLFLASTPSITGTTVCVDNGQHLVPLARDVMFAVETPVPTAPSSNHDHP
jgi:NAD(P)-dependent dehydrogenase (short-subunit alcohol dehydrogenase family)